jgi:hypothetical protein
VKIGRAPLARPLARPCGKSHENRLFAGGFSLGRGLPIISHPKCLALQARHDRRNFERGFLVRL